MNYFDIRLQQFKYEQRQLIESVRDFGLASVVFFQTALPVLFFTYLLGLGYLADKDNPASDRIEVSAVALVLIYANAYMQRGAVSVNTYRHWYAIYPWTKATQLIGNTLLFFVATHVLTIGPLLLLTLQISAGALSENWLFPAFILSNLIISLLGLYFNRITHLSLSLWPMMALFDGTTLAFTRSPFWLFGFIAFAGAIDFKVFTPEIWQKLYSKLGIKQKIFVEFIDRDTTRIIAMIIVGYLLCIFHDNIDITLQHYVHMFVITCLSIFITSKGLDFVNWEQSHLHFIKLYNIKIAPVKGTAYALYIALGTSMLLGWFDVKTVDMLIFAMSLLAGILMINRLRSKFFLVNLAVCIGLFTGISQL